MRSFCEALDEEPPDIGQAQLDQGFAYLWERKERRLRLVRVAGPSQEHRRHVRKYAEGELGADRSFYFRGPDNSLNLRAQNLQLFLQIADGVDDRTWLHHLRAGDYSRWITESLKDSELAVEVGAIEHDAALDAERSRDLVREAIERRYTAAA